MSGKLSEPHGICIPSFDEFTTRYKPYLKAVINKHHRRLSNSYSDSFYDDIYQEALISMWKLYKRIFLQGKFNQYDISSPEVVFGIVKKHVHWKLTQYVGQIQGGSLHEGNHLFRVYNRAMYFDAFNTMTDEEIKDKYCEGSDLTLIRLKQLAACRDTRSLEEPLGETGVFGDTVKDEISQSADKILTRVIKEDFLSLLTEKYKAICELFVMGFSSKEIANALSLNEGTCKNYINDIYDYGLYYGFSRDLCKIYHKCEAKPIIKNMDEFNNWLSADEKLRSFYDKLTELQKFIYVNSFVLGKRDIEVRAGLNGNYGLKPIKTQIIKKAENYKVDIKYYAEHYLREKPSYEAIPFVDPRDRKTVFKVRERLYELIGDRSYNIEHFIFNSPPFYILPLYYFLNGDFSYKRACVLGGYLDVERSNVRLFCESFGISINIGKREIANNLKGKTDAQIKDWLILSRLKTKKLAVEIYSDFIAGNKTIPKNCFNKSGNLMFARLGKILKSNVSNSDLIKKSLENIAYYINYFDSEMPSFMENISCENSTCATESKQNATIQANWEILNWWLPKFVHSEDSLFEDFAYKEMPERKL